MNGFATAAKIALFIAIFTPSAAMAQTFVTPNGTVVNEFGTILSTPIKALVVKDPLDAYRANPKKYEITLNYKGCTSVYSHPANTMAGKVVYVVCPK